MSRIPTSNDEYHIGWICALKEEVAASRAMLDEKYDEIDGQEKDDENSYILGRIGKHLVVIVALPAGRMGKVSAATVAVHMVRTFKNLRGGLLVGIGGGLPQPGVVNEPRLGDVVISHLESTVGGVIQYDLVKEQQGDVIEWKGQLNAPPSFLLAAVNKLQAKHLMEDSSVPEYMDEALNRWPKLRKTGFISPAPEHDYLFVSSCTHVHGAKDCSGCADNTGDVQTRLPRDRDADEGPRIFYGTILSGDKVVKDSNKRDQLRKVFAKEKAMCVEMEAAGIMNSFPCLVIRGICDYADSHKNDQWHNYAAMTAAAYAKELLSCVSPSKTLLERPMSDVLTSIEDGVNNLCKTINQDRVDFRRKQKEEEMIRREEELQKCHADLRTSLYERFKDINPVRTAGTCEWVFQHPKYNAWLAKPEHGLLWVSADPGCGKSVLSKSLVDQVLWQPDTQSTCYFFFKDNDEQDKLSIALCAILHQLFCFQPVLRDHVQKAWGTNRTTMTRDSDKLWSVLIDASQDSRARPVICIFDGLDEATEESRRSLVTKLCEIYKDDNGHSAKLKALVTSRPYESLRRDFESLGSQLALIRLQGEQENQRIHEEIDIVITQRVQDVAEELKMSDAVRERLEIALRSTQNRTYLWVYLAVEDFRDTFMESFDPESQVFDVLPDSVEEAYEKILARTSRKAWIYAHRTFSMVLGARQPLNISQLRLALIVLEEPESFSRVKVQISEKKLETLVRQWCGLFVFFQEGKIHLIHQTAKDFLLRPSNEQPPTPGTWRHSISMEEANRTMQNVCVQFLALPDFDTSDNPIWTTFRDTTQYSSLIDNDIGNLLQYVAYNGSVHLAAGRPGFSAAWDDVRFAAGPSGCPRLSYRFPTHTVNHEDDLCGLIMIHLPMIMAQYDILERRSQIGRLDLDKRAYRGRTVLLIAIELGLYQAVEWLIDKGADIEVRDDDGSDALCIAAGAGYPEIVRLLLRRGARIDSLDISALHEAVRTADETSIALLLDAGVDVDALSVMGVSPLTMAVEQGNAPAVKLLLQKGADPNTGRSCETTPLGAALLKGNEEVLALLIEYGIDLTAKNKHGRTPLEIAFASGNVRVVRMLLQSTKALGDINAKNKALLSACRSSNAELVQMAISFGSDVNVVGAHGSPLHLACRSNKSSIVATLISAGADVNAYSKVGYPMQLACQYANLSMVEYLIQMGADVNIAHGNRGTILEEAVIRGDEDILRTIIARGANLNVCGKHGTILHAALTYSWRPALISLLIRSGAKVNAEAWFDLPSNPFLNPWEPGYGEHEQFCGPALVMALDRDMHEFARILRKAGARGSLSGPLRNVENAVRFLRRLRQHSREQKIELKEEDCQGGINASKTSRGGPPTLSESAVGMAADWSRWRIYHETPRHENHDNRPEDEHDVIGGGQLYRVMASHLEGLKYNPIDPARVVGSTKPPLDTAPQPENKRKVTKLLVLGKDGHSRFL